MNKNFLISLYSTNNGNMHTSFAFQMYGMSIINEILCFFNPILDGGRQILISPPNQKYQDYYIRI